MELKYAELVSRFAFNFNLRPYNLGGRGRLLVLVAVSPLADRFEESDAMLQLVGKLAAVRSRPAADSTEFAAAAAAADHSARQLADGLYIPLTGRGFHSSIFRHDESTVCGIRWVVLVTKLPNNGSG